MTESSPEEVPGQSPIAFSDPGYRAAVVDLLAVIAYGELSAFERLAEDTRLAPSLEDKVALGTMASAEFNDVLRLRDRLVELGADPFEAMTPFREPLDRFHQHTAPSNWLESLVKAYVGDGLARDFYREIAAFVDVDTRELILSSLERTQHSAFVVEKVRAAIEEDHRVSGRLALWGRRLMGRRSRRPRGLRPSVTRSQHCWPVEWTGRAWTWPPSAGCSAGSPRSTPHGWRISVSPTDRLLHRCGHRHVTVAAFI
ncbi:ferritin-like fold-containing protein [Nocardioides alcanivorans]|uniref:ferritin-like fold-containing protein n=1 Tax=Nocardioides alcanivorans TaxID=2897352 RepID=UPI00289EB58D|nr:ferritin-like fold-containing protein [Nocardioides alcanivorans]